ncbi:RIB43A-domain-containing protein [Blastocladiella britannica]|nr:RIB43A-domain-containing protein [Blastocladiella britannica]
MYKLDHAPSLIEHQAIQRRRRLDKERMERIFDPKVRVMGIDVEGLAEQIRIKSELSSIEKERNDTTDRVAIETNELLQLLDSKVVASRRAVHRDMDAFRQDHQQPPMRRDFDLYDPDLLKNDIPARESDVDSRNTVSGMQKFEGEDLEQKDRILAQRRQMQVWAWQKMCENDSAMKKKQSEDQRREQEVIDNNRRIQALMEAERQQRRQVAKEDADFNLMLATEKKLRESERRKMETAKNIEEINANMTGALLTERPAPPQPFPHTLRIDAFKGMTADQIRDIHETRERQIRETRDRAEQERRDQHDWAKHQFWTSRATTLLERERHRNEREKERLMLEQNKELAAEFKLRKHFIDKVVYVNPPQESFFQQFNTTSR